MVDGALGSDTLDNSAIASASMTVSGAGTLDGQQGTATGIGTGYDNMNVLITRPGPGPTGVVATAVTNNQVAVTWNATSGAFSYLVYRRDAGTSDFVQVGSPSGNSFNDNTVSAGNAYAYRVRAIVPGATSDPSSANVATTLFFTNDPLTPGTVISAIHLTQLRPAVNAVRAAAGLGAISFTDPTPTGVVVKGVHISELRTGLNAAFAVFGITGVYTDPSLPGVTIKAIHFQELRNQIQ
jgi:hypothetical protein